MLRFSPRIGLRFREGIQRTLALVARSFSGLLELEDEQGAKQRVTQAQLLDKWQRREWVLDETCLSKASRLVFHAVAPDVRSLSPQEQLKVRYRLRYLLALERAFRKAGGSFLSTVDDLQEKINEEARRFADATPPSAATVWRWWRRFSPTRSAMKLVDMRKNGGRKRMEATFGIYEEAVEEVLLNPEKASVKRIIEALKRKLKRVNAQLPPEDQIAIPADATVYRWTHSLYYALINKAREGKKITDRELRIAQDSVRVEYLLERVEIDHTPLDLLVIDKATALVLGRPWITLAICRKSRCVLGFYISFNAPSAYSVMACVRRAILPKGDILKQFPGLRNDWPCCGIMDLIACDNGMELHSTAIASIALAMSIEIQFCGVAMPQMKGAIERIFRTLAEDLIHQLPGTTFSNPNQRGDYPSERRAAIDMNTLVHLLVKWIVDIYHVTPHRGLSGKTPLEVWREAETDRAIELPTDPAALDVIVSHTAHPTIWHYGVQIDNLYYNSPLLREITLQFGPKQIVEARYRDEDVSSVYILDPRSEEFIEIPSTNRAYTQGLNRATHRLVVARIRERFGDDWKQEQLLEARAEIEEIVAAAIKAKKIIDRKRAARTLSHDSEAVLSPDEIPFDDSPDTDGISGMRASEGGSRNSATLEDDVEGYAVVDLNAAEEFA